MISPAVSDRHREDDEERRREVLQVKIGIRIIVMPGARIRRMVTMKLMAAEDRCRSDDDEAREPEVLARAELLRERRVAGPPRRGRAALREEAGEDGQPADGQEPERERVDPGERHVEAPICSGTK